MKKLADCIARIAAATLLAVTAIYGGYMIYLVKFA